MEQIEQSGGRWGNIMKKEAKEDLSVPCVLRVCNPQGYQACDWISANTLRWNK